jgi:hypothetical protein
MRSCHRGAERSQIHMDDPADDLPHSGPQGEQVPADSRRIVRRTEITVEREITTIILRRRNESTGHTPPPEPPASKDGENGS